MRCRSMERRTGLLQRFPEQLLHVVVKDQGTAEQGCCSPREEMGREASAFWVYFWFNCWLFLLSLLLLGSSAEETALLSK